METKDVVTTITAVVGALTGTAGLILGIMNARRDAERSRSRVRLKLVRQRITTRDGGRFERIAIVVINDSAFDVRVNDAGLLGRGYEKLSVRRNPGAHIDLPKTLNPRTKVTCTFRGGIETSPEMRDVVDLYADLDDESLVRSHDKLLAWFIERANSMARDAEEP